MDHELHMREAMKLAQDSLLSNDVPVGCIIIDKNGVIIGKGRNRREEKKDATSHAEIEAIRDACYHTGSWRLDGCSMYVTLEPCPMCAGAILNSRISVLVYGAKERFSGSCGSVIDLFSENYGHSPAVYSGILSDECSALLKEFFQSVRKQPEGPK